MMWHWEEVDVDRSGSSGDVSKLFKNEEIKRPGILVDGAPPTDATIMAREVIQNSWDAAHDLRRILDERGEDWPDFDIDFRFLRLQGDEAATLRTNVGFAELADRAGRLAGKWSEVGLPTGSALAHPDANELDVLVIEEAGTSGMYGPWRGRHSKMYLAMVSIGFTQKLQGSGGSYGYGKAGLIRGSQTRTVVAYSCFPEQPDDPGVTRRLLGMTYWGPHDLGDEGEFTGFARMGSLIDGGVQPFVNEEADEVAVTLGLDRRNPADGPETFGTTFLVLDPTVDAEGLCRAVERNWWPALVSDNTFGVEIVDRDGTSHPARPRLRGELQAFVRSFEIATTPQDNIVENERQADFGSAKFADVDLELGTLGLVADPTDWSYPPPDVEIEHRSLVALVRGPRMVVEYANMGQARPFVRGCFVAHEDVDDLLRQTEPRAHDAWQTAVGDDSIDPVAPNVAAKVLRTVRSRVDGFRRDLKPPVPDRRELRLPELERLFNFVITGDGNSRKKPPDPEPRYVSIEMLEQDPEVAPEDATLIRLTARVGFSLSDRYQDGDAGQVRLSLRCKFLEDDRAGEECPLTIQWPSGFEPVDDWTATGVLSRERLEVTATSAAYEPDWSTRLTAEAELVEEGADEQ